jgi:hypothetical protein
VLDQQVDPIVFPPSAADLAASIARVASRNYASAPSAPVPFYLRAADAAPPRDSAPVILEDVPDL